MEMKMSMFFFREKAWLWPILFVIFITPFTPYLDLAITHYFYNPTHSFPGNAFYDFLYIYGLLPAQLLFVTAAFYRPRPKQVIEFGGIQEFRPFYQPNFFHQPEPSKSFTCGHCTMGFYFFALALVVRRLNYRKTFWITLMFAFALGIALSLARIGQGGHFFSDTLISALIMWLTAYACDRWLTPQIEA